MTPWARGLRTIALCHNREYPPVLAGFKDRGGVTGDAVVLGISCRSGDDWPVSVELPIAILVLEARRAAHRLLG